MVTVLASGFFDPLHAGHINHLQAAKRLGDHLIVSVVNDEYAKGKKGYYLLPQEQRMQVLRGLRCVDRVLASYGTDADQSDTILCEHPDIFAKGKDRTVDTMPQAELQACAAVGCKIVYGVGDDPATIGCGSTSLVNVALLNWAKETSGGHLPQPLFDLVCAAVPLVGVSVVAINKGRLLLVKRNTAPIKGYWVFPGGRVFRGETPIAAACRELEEETGLRVGEDAMLFLGHESYLYDKRHDIGLTFICEATDDNVMLNDEHSAFVWTTIGNLPKPIHEVSNVTTILSKYTEIGGES